MPVDWILPRSHAGGEFGPSETFDSVTDSRFGYKESGFNGGGQLGYNFQWNWLVLGAEFDVDYMNLTGSDNEGHPRWLLVSKCAPQRTAIFIQLCEFVSVWLL